MAALGKLEYVEESEGLRVVDTGLSKLRIVKSPNDPFWRIETESGPVPVALRGRYTGHLQALVDIKNYVDNHRERQIVYKKLPKKDTE